MITAFDAADIMKRVFAECHNLRNAGQKEYAHDQSNALANFERVSKKVGISREQVLLVFMEKHLDGISSYCQGHKSQRESVEGRINDAIVYLCLLRCMVEDNNKKSKREGPVISKEAYETFQKVYNSAPEDNDKSNT